MTATASTPAPSALQTPKSLLVGGNFGILDPATGKPTAEARIIISVWLYQGNTYGSAYIEFAEVTPVAGQPLPATPPNVQVFQSASVNWDGAYTITALGDYQAASGPHGTTQGPMQPCQAVFNVTPGQTIGSGSARVTFTNVEGGIPGIQPFYTTPLEALEVGHIIGTGLAAAA
jgi:hypothetical protein